MTTSINVINTGITSTSHTQHTLAPRASEVDSKITSTVRERSLTPYAEGTRSRPTSAIAHDFIVLDDLTLFDGVEPRRRSSALSKSSDKASEQGKKTLATGAAKKEAYVVKESAAGVKHSNTHDDSIRSALAKIDYATATKLINTEKGLAALQTHCTRNFTTENLSFLSDLNKVSNWAKDFTRLSTNRSVPHMNTEIHYRLLPLYEKYIKVGSKLQVNISDAMRKEIDDAYQKNLTVAHFTAASNEVSLQLMNAFNNSSECHALKASLQPAGK